MGGKASLVIVLGFAVIFSYINMRINRIVSRAIENSVAYNISSNSRNLARSGANLGLALCVSDPNTYLPANGSGTNEILNRNFMTGPYAGDGLRILVFSQSSGAEGNYFIMRSISRCATFIRDISGNPFVVCDTVDVRLNPIINTSFARFTLLLDQASPRQPFLPGDVIRGKVHNNTAIYLLGNTPVFDSTSSMKSVVSTGGDVFYYRSGSTMDPNSYSKSPTQMTPGRGTFRGEVRTGVKIDFPKQLTDLKQKATKSYSSEIWLELIPGTSADNDGCALVRKGGFSGAVIDSIPLSGDYKSTNGNSLIYSSEIIRIKGKLDGRLTVYSGKDVKIMGNLVYEKPPDCNKHFNDPANVTTDMLGLIAEQDVWIDKDYPVATDINVHAAIFTLHGGFGSEGVLYRDQTGGTGKKPKLNLIGSISAKRSKFVNNDGRDFDGNPDPNAKSGCGWARNFVYDVRMDPPDNLPSSVDPKQFFPPHYPCYTSPAGGVSVVGWFERKRPPINIDEAFGFEE